MDKLPKPLTYSTLLHLPAILKLFFIKFIFTLYSYKNNKQIRLWEILMEKDILVDELGI